MNGMANASSLQRKLIHFVYQAVDPLPVHKQECLSVHLCPIVILVIGNQFHGHILSRSRYAPVFHGKDWRAGQLGGHVRNPLFCRKTIEGVIKCIELCLCDFMHVQGINRLLPVHGRGNCKLRLPIVPCKRKTGKGLSLDRRNAQGKEILRPQVQERLQSFLADRIDSLSAFRIHMWSTNSRAVSVLSSCLELSCQESS